MKTNEKMKTKMKQKMFFTCRKTKQMFIFSNKTRPNIWKTNFFLQNNPPLTKLKQEEKKLCTFRQFFFSLKMIVLTTTII